MNRHASRVLGFDRLLGLLAAEARTPQGSDACLELDVAGDGDAARALLRELADFDELERELGFPPLDGVGRIEGALEKAKTPGACLDVEAILAVRDTVSAAARLIEYLEDAQREGSPIGSKVEGHEPLYGLETRFARTFGARGEILDSASPELAAIREEQRKLRVKVLRTLQGIIKGPEFDSIVRDDFITERQNRFVIPLTTDFRGYLKGIIHDHSRTGQTVFVEPLEVVETNNRFNQAKEEEEEEIRRILVAVTAEIGASSTAILGQIALAAWMDRLAAKLRLARRLDCAMPAIADAPVLDVGHARHPLLANRKDIAVVPIDIRLKEEERLLLITGANAGGKTVALKTAGLMTLMAKAGMFIPAQPGSTVGWFPEVLADIGDEQDLDRDLSTFSAHMARLGEVFDCVSEGTLVLLDEMGTGTDPGQGGALSVAALEELAASGARVIATTHLDGLKAFVYSAPWGVNAAVSFDQRTGKPLYRLEYGHAGVSNALEVAAKMGVPKRVLDRARSVAGQGGDQVGKLMGDLEEALNSARKREEEAGKRAEKLDVELSRQRELTEEARGERRAAKEEARKEAREMIRRMREELKTALDRLIAGEIQRKDAQAAFDRVGEEAERRFPKAAAETGMPLDAGSIKPGRKVFVTSLGKDGVVDGEPSSGKVRVKIGAMPVTVSISDLFASADSAKAAPPKGRRGAAKPVAPQSEAGRVRVEAERRSPDVVLIGMTVDEALEEFDRALNRALVGNMERFRVVHGRGSGALRNAVRKCIAEDPKRLRFVPEESDDAVTWIELI